MAQQAGDARNEMAAHIEKVAQVTKESSAATGQTAGAVSQLELLADVMRNTVNLFKIKFTA